MKRKISFLLCALIVTSSLNACTSKNTDKNHDTSSGTPSGSGSVDSGESSEGYYVSIPDGTNYGGGSFTILTYPNDGSIWGDVDWSSEGYSGEVLGDAVYGRMRDVSDALNISIRTAYMTSYYDSDTLSNSIAAQDNAYQLATPNINHSFIFAQNGRIHELNAFSDNGTLDLTAPWWDGHILDDLSIAHKNFCLTGDIGTMYKKSIGVIMFNKKIREQNTLDDPYTLVNSGKWTVDRMVAMGSAISNDLNGDGVMDERDQYGLICFCDMMPVAMIGCGVDFFTKNSADIPQNTFYNERTVSVIEKLAELMYNSATSYSWSKKGTGEASAIDMYQTDHALFYYGELHAVASMRDMESPFGILPMPKYDESQSEYYHSVNPNVAAVYVIPITNTEYDKTGYVMDSLGAASKNRLTPAYYETTLKGKVTRDEESRESLDIIIGTVRYDLGYLGGWGLSSILYNMADSYSIDLASQYAAVEESINASVNKLIERIENLETQRAG